MPEERREQVTRVGIEQGQRVTGGTRRFRWKAAAFHGWHEPDKSRGLRPESVSGLAGRLGPGLQCPGLLTSSWDSNIRRTQIASGRNYGNVWGSLGWNSTQKRRAGSSSGGTPKRTGNEEEKGNPRRSISWASGISAGRTGMGGSRCDARRSLSACEQSYGRSSKSSARVCTIPYLKLANGSNRSCRATSTTMRYQETSTASRCSENDCWDCGGADCVAGAKRIGSLGTAR